MILFAASVIFHVLNFIVLTVNLALGKGATFGKYRYIFFFNKVTLVPSIALIYLQVAEYYQSFSRKIVFYMIFAWFGDVFLFSNQFGFTLFGAISFAISHFAVISFYDIHWLYVPKYFILLVLPGTLFLFAHLIPKIKLEYNHEYFVVLYCIILQFTYASAAARCSTYPLTHPSFLMCYIGYFFFLVSDYFLIKKELKISPKPRRVEIMSTYAIAQTLIILGTALAL
ncbi:yhhn family protein [Tritrichomonas foetus]|uniref:Yhhn family protein n=1 Tax=Tritrichomonas foetus TaxID=1144522 RepID=A0A1J4L3Z0_9EUKA|nr:yhhn family protein [Tritrichomonas foetus]|eukprot:OHT16637.1 yhhn family protein [Tritrichomonas foetus]